MLPQVRKGGEYSDTTILVAVERVSVVESLMSTQPIQGGEGFLTAIAGTSVRSMLGMDSEMDLQRV